MTNLAALVPMRHHSQRVPGKNYRPGKSSRFGIISKSSHLRIRRKQRRARSVTGP